MASAPQKYVDLAKTLPPRLLKFFQRYPPPKEWLTIRPPDQLRELEELQNTELPYRHNPFMPRFNAVTKRWQGPVFSLRRQAELCKMAARYGVEDLLPYSRKKPTEIRRAAAARVEEGMDYKAKGHKWERNLKSKLDKRREAMMNMPAMIQEWKLRGHGKGWTKWPK
ncbi:hypothetical protein IWX49DRAFT_564617 [Phyllosticta citricarpa]|uniref:Large ribosomal subunit protein mL59 domain-containing protein n=2 Tax=Phyllosticta TaxID=121621 RepID=A0ABR1MJY6_9PEZI